MIVIFLNDRELMDCEALAVELGRPVATIRHHCKPVAKHAATGRWLFDAEDAARKLSAVPRRVPHKRTRRS